tara:strand:+ start:335 stop:490 length:156 start_codon:yes stop_codon:yes gene_type:complete
MEIKVDSLLQLVDMHQLVAVERVLLVATLMEIFLVLVRVVLVEHSQHLHIP